jgi:protein SCO1/2
LTALLREDHAVYNQRSAAAVVRMRGWLLLALGRTGLPEPALIHVLEELDTGHDGYIVAAAARALRSSSPRPEFGPFLIQAIGNMRYRDDAVAFDSYGAYASSADPATPIRELLATVTWLGPQARAIRPSLEALRVAGSGLSRKLLPDLERAIAAVGTRRAAAPVGDCCDWRASVGAVLRWPLGNRADIAELRSTVFEDHTGTTINYADFFVGQPSIVAFFYTRCDNPQKCSLTVAKLARVQQLLAEAGFAGRVRTAAITYDPGFDLPPRLRAYGQSRQMQMDGDHRLLRATEGIEILRCYFQLQVNFIESLVNRHRIEIYVLDAMGRIAGSFARIHWNERDVVDRAVELLGDHEPQALVQASSPSPAGRVAPTAVGTLASLGVAVFPKCPICWASYMSVLGISSLVPVPYSPWMEPVLFVAMALNAASVWWRCRTVGRMAGFHLVAAGAAAIIAARMQWLPEPAAMVGVLLTAAGAVAGAWGRLRPSSGRARPGVLEPRGLTP